MREFDGVKPCGKVKKGVDLWPIKKSMDFKSMDFDDDVVTSIFQRA
jgi:hypothetical protein